MSVPCEQVGWEGEKNHKGFCFFEYLPRSGHPGRFDVLDVLEHEFDGIHGRLARYEDHCTNPSSEKEDHSHR